MTTESQPQILDPSVVVKAIEDRRASVIAAITRHRPDMADKKTCDDALAAAKDAAYHQIFDNEGHWEPTIRFGANFVAWRIDRHLWQRFAITEEPFPFQDSRPGPIDGPPSGQLRLYQVDRLAKKVAEATEIDQERPVQVHLGTHAAQQNRGIEPGAATDAEFDTAATATAADAAAEEEAAAGSTERS
jgi:hypothetical protein